MMRVGTGFDVHRLAGGRKLIIGGVVIPAEEGLLGHSDADVLLHAICDALLGAAGLGDIGSHFPDSDLKYKGISSLLLFEDVQRLLAEEGFRVHNIDATIVAEKPRMAPHIPAMVANIAKAAGVARSAVNVKATTTEGLGYTGRGEGMASARSGKWSSSCAGVFLSRFFSWRRHCLPRPKQAAARAAAKRNNRIFTSGRTERESFTWPIVWTRSRSHIAPMRAGSKPLPEKERRRTSPGSRERSLRRAMRRNRARRSRRPCGSGA
jgi:2-C-methyl-D-erythritol 2,4-cyclodiphosphate synthase